MNLSPPALKDEVKLNYFIGYPRPDHEFSINHIDDAPWWWHKVTESCIDATGLDTLSEAQNALNITTLNFYIVDEIRLFWHYYTFANCNFDKQYLFWLSPPCGRWEVELQSEQIFDEIRNILSATHTFGHLPNFDNPDKGPTVDNKNWLPSPKIKGLSPS